MTSIARSSHGYLATPRSLAVGDRVPAVLAVNGHGGSAWQMMDSSSVYYWYGESFARRGFVVLAVDISHRPSNDRLLPPDFTQPLYSGYCGNDDLHGDPEHPAIKAQGFDSDFEEDGERVWDAMRALDYLLGLPFVDPNRVTVIGLSMGGEIATFIGALDERAAAVIAAGFSPDLGVVLYHGNHPCWRWIHADIREYVDTSDLHALIAPRQLIVETGKVDPTYSSFHPSFAADKQVARRTRAAYGAEVPYFVHYLHYDEHRYHVGDVNPAMPGAEQGVRVPAFIGPPTAGSTSWQTDPTSTVDRPTVFDYLP
jgi:dienelactone hydrolase